MIKEEIASYLRKKNFLILTSFENLQFSVGVVTNVLDCDIAVSEFEFQARCYVHFSTNNPQPSYT